MLLYYYAQWIHNIYYVYTNYLWCADHDSDDHLLIVGIINEKKTVNQLNLVPKCPPPLTVNLRNQGFKHGGRIPRGCNQIRVHNVDISCRVERNPDHAVRVVWMIFAKPAERNRLAAHVMIHVKEVFNAFAHRVILVLHRDVESVAERGVGCCYIHVAVGILNV